MEEGKRFRYRIRFAKTDAVRFTGHLDVHHAWERALRRARLPVLYSKGYSPRPRLSLAAALPLGFTSDCELADILLEAEWDPSKLQQALSEAAPPGLVVAAVDRIEEGEPSLQSQVESAEYLARLGGQADAGELKPKVSALLASSALPRVRRGKAYDLRPLIEHLHVAEQDGEVLLQMWLAARQGATGRPDEILLALGLEPARSLITRTKLVLKEAEEAPV